MASHYWMSGFVAYIHTVFQQPDTKIILGLDVEEEFWIFFFLVLMLLYTADLQVICVL